MKHTPLLFDKIKADQGLRNAVTPFVIDPETLKHCWSLSNLPDLLDLARSPYQQTWLELTPGELGVLIVTTEVAFVMTFFWEPKGTMIPFVVIVSRDGSLSPCGWIDELEATVNVEPFGLGVTDHLRAQALATPLPDYAKHVGICIFTQHIPRHGEQKCVVMVADILTRYKGVVAATLALLAAMSHCPTQTIPVAPAGRFVTKGRHGYRSVPFHAHTVVRIEMTPHLMYRTLENQARHTGVKHREHEVRGHWRTLRRGRPDEFKVFVKSHKRGDPALGSIVHDAYETVRIERSIGPCP